LATLKLEFQIK